MKYIYALLSIIVLTFTACSENNKVETFRIGTNYWPGYEPLHLAKTQNAYKENIDVITYPSSSVVLNKFRDKEIEAAALTLDEVILLKEQGFEPYIIVVLDISDGADVLLSKKTINSLSELQGKSIGLENSALGSYILVRILEMANLKHEDIQIVPLGINQHEAAFKDDVIDAVITFEPVRSALLKFGAHEIFTTKDIPGEIVDVVVVQKEFAKSKYIKDILNAWSVSSQKIIAKDKESIHIVATHLGQTDEEFLDSLSGIKFPTLEESNTMIQDSSLKSTINKIQNIMLEKKLIKKKIKAETLLE